MTSLTKIYKKSTTYQLNLHGIIQVTGYYETTITGTRYVKGERPTAVSTTKITDKPRLVVWWPKTTHKNTVLTLQGILEAKQVAQVQPIRLTGTKATPTKKAPVLTIVAPLKTTTAVIATEQNAEPAESGSSDDGGESSEEPDHEAALKRLMAQLEYDLALSLEEELEESECEQEEIADWTDDAEVGNTLVDTSNTLTRLEFLRYVLPPTGKYCVVSIQKGKVLQTFPDSIEEIDTWAELQPALGNDSYMALATFDDERRLARCALEYKSVYIDLDCGPNTAYATQDEGMVALRAFVDKVKLPKPTVVSSGGGFHVYFTFTEAADYDQWHSVANTLKARIIAENFAIKDIGITTDASRILRLPNTINFKNNTETEVKVLIAGTNATVEDYNRILNVGAEISPTVITPKKDFVPNATVAPVVKAPAKVEEVFVADAAKPEVKQLFNETPVVNKVNSLGDSLINYLPNVMAPTNFTTITLKEALTNIESGEFAELLAPVRVAYKEYLVSDDKTAYTTLKRTLPSFAFNGTFTERVKNEHLLKSSNLFCGDVDGLGGEDEVAATISKLIQEVPSLVSVFRSPSNDGVKFILALPSGTVSNNVDFGKVFDAVSQHFKQRLDVAIDKACRDVRRVCFVSYDPNIYINYNAVLFTYEPVADEAKSKTEAFGETSTAVNTYLENLAIDVASGLLRKAKSGERHGARVKVGRLIGGYVAGGWAREDVLVEAVMVVSDEISDGSHTNDVEIKTIHDGIAYGKGSPITEEMFKKEQGINMEIGFFDGATNTTRQSTQNIHTVKSGYISTKNSNYSCEQWMDICNSNLAVVCVNGSMRVVSLGYDTDKKQSKWSFVSFETFKQRYNSDYLWHKSSKMVASGRGKNKTVELVEDEVRVKAGTYWLENESRAGEADLIFDPEKPPVLTVRGVVNLWTGLNIFASSEGGNPMPMVNHIRDVLASGLTEHADYILHWTALLIQRPGLHHGIALVLRGEKGVGKGVYGNLIQKIFGQHGKRISQPKHLVGQFSGHLRNCCFLFADEAFFAGDSASEGRLKELITEPTFMAENKGVDADDIVNHLSVLMTTNSEFVVPATKDERRYAMFDVPSNKLGDSAYWDMLIEWESKPENVTAFVEYLRSIDLSNFKPRQFVETKALKDQRLLNLDAWAQWWCECLAQGCFGGNAVWPEYLCSGLVNTSFAAFTKQKRFDKYDGLSPTILASNITNNKLAPKVVQGRFTQADKLIIKTEGEWGHLTDSVLGGPSHYGITYAEDNKPIDNRYYYRKMPSLAVSREAFIKTFNLSADIFETE